MKRLSTILPYSKPAYNAKNDARFHPTQKPLKLFEDLITQCCPPNGVVLDPFSGAGTTAVAARNTQRKFIAIEMDDEYVQRSRQRLAG